ncbi:unnamed protein product [Adineta steineri]|uniref:Amidase domain-containing protein n=1 Tax=Adineta steineri TaxID=433720 RepID=A0A815FP56_9BILA|nr:unnamed protein product [Adineta steineri]CAF1328341.1 unnamed protein product [Adineta steineri]
MSYVLVLVPSPNLTFTFESSDALKNLPIINTVDIARQLELAYSLSRNSLANISIASDPTTDNNRQNCLVKCTVTNVNNTHLILQVIINYLPCGRFDFCKIALFNEINESFDNDRDPFPIDLQYNDSTQSTVYIKRCKTSIYSIVKQFNLYNASIAELQDGLSKRYFTSVDLVKAYIARIDEVNIKGPKLRAVIEISPTALDAAHATDILRQNGTILSSLHGIPILLKDNIATRPEDGMNTTAGSFALLGSITPDDATVVKKLRNAGAVILGKTSLSEWANFRSVNMTNGWSGRGGQATSAFYPQGDACGSSTGSGIASSIGLAAASLGTETDGSIVCPGSRSNLVGIKPTVGLTSRHLVIPISQNQDSVGPMCQSVADVAAILTIIAGRDNEDNFTLAQPEKVPDYSQYLNANGLRGARIGVLRKIFANSTFGGYPDYIISEFNKTIEEIFKKLGANITDPADLDTADEIATAEHELIVLKYELKDGINQYLSQLKSIPSNTTTLQDLINFNIAHPDLELPPGRDNQNLFLEAQNTTHLQDFVYTNALAIDFDLGRRRGIDATLKKYNLDALIAPTEGFTSSPPGIAGYPIITVPLGFLPNDTKVTTNENTASQKLPIWPAPNFPFGLSFIGTAYSEAKLIELAYSYEQATQHKRIGMPFAAAIPKTQLTDILCPK